MNEELQPTNDRRVTTDGDGATTDLIVSCLNALVSAVGSLDEISSSYGGYPLFSVEDSKDALGKLNAHLERKEPNQMADAPVRLQTELENGANDDDNDDNAELGALVDKVLNYRKVHEDGVWVDYTINERIANAHSASDTAIGRLSERVGELERAQRKTAIGLDILRGQKWLRAIVICSLMSAASVAATLIIVL